MDLVMDLVNHSDSVMDLVNHSELVMGLDLVVEPDQAFAQALLSLPERFAALASGSAQRWAQLEQASPVSLFALICFEVLVEQHQLVMVQLQRGLSPGFPPLRALETLQQEFDCCVAAQCLEWERMNT